MSLMQQLNVLSDKRRIEASLSDTALNPVNQCTLLERLILTGFRRPVQEQCYQLTTVPVDRRLIEVNPLSTAGMMELQLFVDQ